MKTVYDEFKKWKNDGRWKTYTTIHNNGRFGEKPAYGTYTTIDNSGRFSEKPLCANCGKTKGQHFTTEGISWCHSLKDRMTFSKDEAPDLHTTFSHEPSAPVEKKRSPNPNVAFKLQKREVKLREREVKLQELEEAFEKQIKSESEHKTANLSYSYGGSDWHLAYDAEGGKLSTYPPCEHEALEETPADLSLDSILSCGEMTTSSDDLPAEIDLSDLPPGEYYIDTNGFHGQNGRFKIEVGDGVKVQNVSEKLYGGSIEEVAEKISEKINEKRRFLEEPKNEGGQDNGDE